ncbi:MAG TPA: M48 family metallopeptidase [Kiritimatiellia bacterium]|nr:M48 family metallopeptidase [Kiritimatiellia bacterium]
MDFFARQEHARKRTGWLVFMFVVALIGIIASAYIACVTVIQFAFTEEATTYGAVVESPSPWQPELLLTVATVICLIVLGGTTFKLAELKKGGSKVAEMLGGKKLDPASNQMDERRLLNVVEEMAIASGVPVPPVYVMHGEQGINAFAAGYSINDAVIGVTEGAMRGLTRDELQGVIAHEFSHILNGDMRLNIRLIGVLHGLLILALVGRIMLRFAGSGRSGGGKKGGGAIVVVVLGLALMIIGYFGFFFGGLIKRAVSRQREYLADSSAVQFTRNPTGLASALKKVGGLAYGGSVGNNHAEELSHMFFADGVKRLFGAGSLFATHPPLAQRVKLLDPTFDGKFPVITEDMLRMSVNQDQGREKKSDKAGKNQGHDFIKKSVMMGGAIGTDPRTIIQQMGVLDAITLDAAQNVMAAIPEALKLKAHETLGAQAVVLALLLRNADANSSVDAWTWIPASFTDAVSQCLDAMADIRAEHRLPLLEMTFPALRSLGKEQAEKFMELLRQIITSDKKIDIFEFTVFEIVSSGMRETLQLPLPPVKIHSIKDVMPEATILLSKMAQVGGDNEASIKAAFDVGMASLPEQSAGAKPVYVQNIDADKLRSALDRMLTTGMSVRKMLLEAAANCLMADQNATVQEVELFRAFASALQVPAPPIQATA